MSEFMKSKAKRLLAPLLSLAAITNASADSLKIHVITPKLRIDWSSPRRLALTSGWDSIGNDYAPIGHFATEIRCSKGNGHTRDALTGMERQSKKESRKITLSKELGLGSLIYPFEGALVTAAKTKAEIELAKRQGRLTTLEIFTSEERCDRMLEFVEKWIDEGSYRVYGGGKDAIRGEGAGCADFAMSLFSIATGTPPPPAWFVSISVPNSLIGDGHGKTVPFRKLLTRGDWARPREQSTSFTIADTNLTTDWAQERLRPESREYLYTEHLFPTNVVYPPEMDFRKLAMRAVENLPPHGPLEDFKFHYPTERPAQEIWDEIKIGERRL
jgi:hypothetical protein